MLAQCARLDITPREGHDAGKEWLINLRDKVERLIGAEQVARKRALSREERDVSLQRQIDNSVMQHNSFWRKDEKFPAIALPVDKQGDAYVTVNDVNVKLLSIAPSFRGARDTGT